MKYILILILNDGWDPLFWAVALHHSPRWRWINGRMKRKRRHTAVVFNAVQHIKRSSLQLSLTFPTFLFLQQTNSTFVEWVLVGHKQLNKQTAIKGKVKQLVISLQGSFPWYNIIRACLWQKKRWKVGDKRMFQVHYEVLLPWVHRSTTAQCTGMNLCYSIQWCVFSKQIYCVSMALITGCCKP